MNEAKKLIQQITEGIQDKKGKKIVIADLTRIDDTICNYFVICQGNSPSQVSAIVESVKDFTRKGANSKPFAIDGLRNAEWVAMDYSDVLVHVFQPEAREFYNLEHLWADAKLPPGNRENVAEEIGGQVGCESRREESEHDAQCHAQCPEYGNGGVFPHVLPFAEPLYTESGQDCKQGCRQNGGNAGIQSQADTAKRCMRQSAADEH